MAYTAAADLLCSCKRGRGLVLTASKGDAQAACLGWGRDNFSVLQRLCEVGGRHTLPLIWQRSIKRLSVGLGILHSMRRLGYKKILGVEWESCALVGMGVLEMRPCV